MKRTTILGFCFTALVALAVWAPNVLAYEYNGSCTTCHNWFNSSHENHKSRTSCSTCHDGNRNGYTTASSCANSKCHAPLPLQIRHVDNYGQSCDRCHELAPPPPPPACNDSDGDGYGAPGDSTCPNGSLTDCNDSDPSINPGADENCTDKKDNNCNDLVDTQDPSAVNCPSNCTDNDLDTYSPDGGTCGQVDCDDTRASVNPGVGETCDDGFDNNCNGQTDCDDSSCSGDAACVLEFCADYTDRGSCKADPRCSWSGKNKECTEPVVSDAQSNCEADGGRWNKKKETCTIR